jgi:NADH:ubiquinone oxidoreductase subunit 6 (subunit J)
VLALSKLLGIKEIVFRILYVDLYVKSTLFFVFVFVMWASMVKSFLNENPIIAVLYLIGVYMFFSFYISLWFDDIFVGLLILLVYVGAIVVFMLFVVMAMVLANYFDLSTENQVLLTFCIIVWQTVVLNDIILHIQLMR